jgi:hypothetical protein
MRENVNYRAMRPFSDVSDGAGESGTDRVALPEDWARTKAKTADLSFHLPKIVALPGRPEFTDAAPVVTSLINRTLRRMDAHYTMDECLADVINAAGVMAVVVGMDIRTETIPVSTAPAGAPVDPAAPPVAETPVTRRVYQSPTLNRISFADLLWPSEFGSSNWRKARWLGYQTSMTEAEVRGHTKWRIPKDWKIESTAKVETLSDDLRASSDQQNKTPTVRVTIVWYYAAAFDEDKTHPECLRTLTFVTGIDEPVEEGDADEQVWVPETPAIPPSPPSPEFPEGSKGSPAVRGHYEGLTRLPILVETLVYVSDLAVPPSDSQIGRSSVRELMRSRSQMIRQRDHSIPIRWYDTNRLDETIVDSMRAGRWQDMIPVNGPGDRVIGEVARAAYPRDNFTFDAIIKQGLDQSWSLSNNQLSQPNAETKSATEVNAVSSASQKRSDYEKERVNRFVVAIGEVVFSLMQRYETYDDYVTVVGPDGADALQAVTPEMVKGQFEFDFVADSSDRLDAQTRQANLFKAYNLMANSASTNRRALEAAVWTELGHDPKKFMSPPAEPAPEAPNVSFRFGGEDLLNPMAVAIMLKSQEITPTDIQAAALMIKDAVAQVQAANPAIVPKGATLTGPPPAAPVQEPVTPPDTNEPILKRGADGSRFV